jgi:hypothetical protein
MSNFPMKRVSVMVDAVTWARVLIADSLHLRGVGRERAGGILIRRALDALRVPFPSDECPDGT